MNLTLGVCGWMVWRLQEDREAYNYEVNLLVQKMTDIQKDKQITADRTLSQQKSALCAKETKQAIATGDNNKEHAVKRQVRQAEGPMRPVYVYIHILCCLCFVCLDSETRASTS